MSWHPPSKIYVHHIAFKCFFQHAIWLHIWISHSLQSWILLGARCRRFLLFKSRDLTELFDNFNNGFLILTGFGTFLPTYEHGTQYLDLSPIRSSLSWSRAGAECTRVDRDSLTELGRPVNRLEFSNNWLKSLTRNSLWLRCFQDSARGLFEVQ